MSGAQAGPIGSLDGMKAAEEAANRAVPCWSDLALEELLSVCRELGNFTIEQLRERSSIGSPTHERAWGGVVNAASRKKLITKVGYKPSKSSNGLPVTVWRVA